MGFACRDEWTYLFFFNFHLDRLVNFTAGQSSTFVYTPSPERTIDADGAVLNFNLSNEQDFAVGKAYLALKTSSSSLPKP